MAITDTVVRITGATFNGTALDGPVAVQLNSDAIQRAGMSGAEVGQTSLDTVGEGLMGSIITDDEDDDLQVLALGVGILVVTFKKAGGVSGTLTIGESGTGVIFTEAGEMTINLADGNGPTLRNTLAFFGVYKAAYLTTFGSTGTALAVFS